MNNIVLQYLRITLRCNEYQNQLGDSMYNILNITTKIAACIGAINWGLIALFDLNLVTAIFGVGTVTHAVYLVVAASGLFQLFETIKTVLMVEKAKSVL